MIMAWQMPVYREPTSIEITINDWVRQFHELFDYSLNSNGMLAYWWYHPHRQPLSWFSIVIWFSTMWFACSTVASWRALRAQAALATSQPAPQVDSSINARALSPHKSTTNDGLVPQTPAQPKSIPLLNGALTNGSSSVTDNHLPFGIGKHVDDRTGRVSTPDYQTPFVNNLNRRNFSGLAKTAPVSYDTLRRNGLLDAAGTPTKKYSPAARNGHRTSPDDEVHVQSGEVLVNVDQSAVGFEEVQRQAEDVKAQWVEDKSDGRVQHFSPAK